MTDLVTKARGLVRCTQIYKKKGHPTGGLPDSRMGGPHCTEWLSARPQKSQAQLQSHTVTQCFEGSFLRVLTIIPPSAVCVIIS